MLFGKNKKEVIYSPLNGTLKPITEAPDPVFSKKMVGDGFCIEPKDGKVVSPVDGTIAMIMESKHALGITTKKGTEILVHFGMDTVSLKGEGIRALVKTGDKVKVGTPLLEVDVEKIKDKVPSLITPVVITNLDDREIGLIAQGDIQRGQEVMEIK